MQQKSQQKLYKINVVYASGRSREIIVLASSRDIAEKRALKRTGALSVRKPT